MTLSEKMRRICNNCFLWSPNKKHPSSGKYKSSATCLERINEGFVYLTNKNESCSRFQRITEEPLPL